MQAAQLERREIHLFLIQNKIQPARPPSLTGMEAIFDLRTPLEKFGSWLRKSAQVCAEIWSHVLDAEQAIERIEQQLRAAAAVAGNVDSTLGIFSEQQKAMEDRRPTISALRVLNISNSVRGPRPRDIPKC
jgi:hypothetical protein